MTSFLHSATYWLPPLLLIAVCIWAMLSVKTSSSEKNSEPSEKNSPPETFIPEVQRQGRRTVWIGTPLLMAVCLAGGYAIRDHQLVSNTVFYTAVAIHPPSKPDTDFDLQPARMQPIPSKLCRSLVDWKFGETLKDLTFEQMQGCKRVMSYHRYDKGEELNASIQVR